MNKTHLTKTGWKPKIHKNINMQASRYTNAHINATEETLFWTNGTNQQLFLSELCLDHNMAD